MRARLGLVLFACLHGAVFAQVTASQAPTAPPPATQEICPLQLDFDLSSQALHKSFGTAPEGATVGTSTSRYTCDKARVTRITMAKPTVRRNQVQLVASVDLATDWVRQDLNLTIEFLVNGESKQKQEWRSLTIGTVEGAAAYIPFGGSSPKTRELKWWAKRSDFETWFSDDSKPSIRVRLEIAQ